MDYWINWIVKDKNIFKYRGKIPLNYHKTLLGLLNKPVISCFT